MTGIAGVTPARVDIRAFLKFFSLLNIPQYNIPLLGEVTADDCDGRGGRDARAPSDHDQYLDSK
jgi:hypothetical protein